MRTRMRKSIRVRYLPPGSGFDKPVSEGGIRFDAWGTFSRGAWVLSVCEARILPSRRVR